MPSTSTAPPTRVVEAAQQLGERRLAGAVLPDDGQRRAGRDREVEPVEHERPARVAERHVAEAELGTGGRWRVGADRADVARAPAGGITDSSRTTAATGAAAPSSAQLSPPKAIALTPIAACRATIAAARSSRPSAARSASDQNATHVGRRAR